MMHRHEEWSARLWRQCVQLCMKEIQDPVKNRSKLQWSNNREQHSHKSSLFVLGSRKPNYYEPMPLLPKWKQIAPLYPALTCSLSSVSHITLHGYTLFLHSFIVYYALTLSAWTSTITVWESLQTWTCWVQVTACLHACVSQEFVIRLENISFATCSNTGLPSFSSDTPASPFTHNVALF